MFSAYMFNWLDRQYSRIVGDRAPDVPKDPMLEIMSQEEWNKMRYQALKDFHDKDLTKDN